MEHKREKQELQWIIVHIQITERIINLIVKNYVENLNVALQMYPAKRK